MWEEVDDEALSDVFISTLPSSERTRFLDKFQQYRHNVCRAPATEIAPSPLLGEGREGGHVQGDKSMPAAELDRVDCVGKLFGFWSGGDGRHFRYRTRYHQTQSRGEPL